MNKNLAFAVVALALAAVSFAQQTPQRPSSGALSSPKETPQTDVLISTLPIDELTKQIAAQDGKIEDTSEVARGGPVAVVVRSTGCMKDEAGHCNITANVTVYKPDGSIFHEAKALDVSAGRVTVPLDIDANAATGLYKVVVTVRDLTARRFPVLERKFAVK